MMINAIEILEYLCARSRVMCPCAESSADVLAAIRGICMGMGDPIAQECFGDFPEFVRQHVSHQPGESWLESIEKSCGGLGRRETLDVVRNLINDWKQSHPKMPDAIPVMLKEEYPFDFKMFELIEDFFRHPKQYVPNASTLAEILAFVRAFLNTRWPPHGYAPGIESLSVFISNRFAKPPIFPMEAVLLSEINQVPYSEACRSVADLIRTWRSQVNES